MAQSGTMGVKPGPSTRLFIVLSFITGLNRFQMMAMSSAAVKRILRRHGGGGACRKDDDIATVIVLDL